MKGKSGTFNLIKPSSTGFIFVVVRIRSHDHSESQCWDDAFCGTLVGRCFFRP